MNYIQMPKSQYSVRVEFPFLGGRLVALQRFVIEQDPGDLWTLYYDKRDICESMIFFIFFFGNEERRLGYFVVVGSG